MAGLLPPALSKTHVGAVRTAGQSEQQWSVTMANGAIRLAQHTAEILTSSSPVTYQRGAQRDLTTPAEAYTVVEAIFGLMPSIRELKLSWLQRVRCRGAMYEAGCTWLSAALEGRHVYAFISSQGMLEWPAGSGKVWLFLEVYPAQGRDEYDMWSTRA